MKKKFVTLLLAVVSVVGACGTETTVDENVTTGDLTTQNDEKEVVEDELTRILDEGVLKVGVEGTYPPFTYHDENGDLVGYDVEVAKAIGDKLGVEVEFVESDWDSLLVAIDSGRIDAVVNAVTITDERKLSYEFSDAYVYSYRRVYVRDDYDEIQGPDDLNGKKIATNITNAYADELTALGAEIVPVDTAQEAITLLEQGRVDFLHFTDLVYGPIVEAHPEYKVKVAFTFDDGVETYGIPVKKGETRLAEAINDALAELSEEGTLSEISNKYLGGDYTTADSVD